MDISKRHPQAARFFPFIVTGFLILIAVIGRRVFLASDATPTMAATYSQGSLHINIPYQATRAGSGQLTLEVLDPDDHVVGSATRRLQVAEGQGRWQDTIKLHKPVPLDDLVWHRVRYRFEYDGENNARLEGTESISQILLRPVVHILAQQSYLAGSRAAVRVIATDSNNEVIPGRSSVRIEFPMANEIPTVIEQTLGSWHSSPSCTRLLGLSIYIG